MEKINRRWIGMDGLKTCELLLIVWCRIGSVFLAPSGQSVVLVGVEFCWNSPSKKPFLSSQIIGFQAAAEQHGQLQFIGMMNLSFLPFFNLPCSHEV